MFRALLTLIAPTHHEPIRELVDSEEGSCPECHERTVWDTWVIRYRRGQRVECVCRVCGSVAF